MQTEMNRAARAALVAAALIAALLAVPRLSSSAADATWYVAPTGSDAYSCRTEARPCKTIQTAINRATAGGIVRVAPGTYYERLTIKKALRLQGSGAHRTIVDAQRAGRVLLIDHDDVTVAGLTLQHGQLKGPGGGVSTDGWNITLDRLIIQRNSAYDEGYGGGGVYNADGLLTINNSTIVNNVALNIGGGITNDDGSIITITNSLIRDNYVIAIPWSTNIAAKNEGAGILNGLNMCEAGCHPYNLIIINSTITSNSAPRGGGILNAGDALIVNTTIADNPGGGLRNRSDAIISNTILKGARACSGRTVTSLGHNLERGTSCGLNGPGDLSGVDPLLDVLRNNGGPTWTRALLRGSPALNAGSCEQLFDQRGAPRPSGAGCDIGAYERGPFVGTATPSLTPSVTSTATETPTETEIPTDTPWPTTTEEPTITDIPTETEPPTETQPPTTMPTLTASRTTTGSPPVTPTATLSGPTPTTGGGGNGNGGGCGDPGSGCGGGGNPTPSSVIGGG